MTVHESFLLFCTSLPTSASTPIIAAFFHPLVQKLIPCIFSFHPPEQACVLTTNTGQELIHADEKSGNLVSSGRLTCLGTVFSSYFCGTLMMFRSHIRNSVRLPNATGCSALGFYLTTMIHISTDQRVIAAISLL